MAILKNKTQGNFTMVSNQIFRNRALSMKERGLLCTIISLPDNWVFSVKGLLGILPDGEDPEASCVWHYSKRQAVP